jgi:hypothetical protein
MGGWRSEALEKVQDWWGQQEEEREHMGGGSA